MQWLSTRADFAPDCYDMGGASDFWWVQARDLLNKHSAMHRTTPTGKNYLGPNVNHAKIEKPWCNA